MGDALLASSTGGELLEFVGVATGLLFLAFSMTPLLLPRLLLLQGVLFGITTQLGSPGVPRRISRVVGAALGVLLRWTFLSGVLLAGSADIANRAFSIQQGSDPVTFFSPDLLFDELAWLKGERAPDVSEQIGLVPGHHVLAGRVRSSDGREGTPTARAQLRHSGLRRRLGRRDRPRRAVRRPRNVSLRISSPLRLSSLQHLTALHSPGELYATVGIAAIVRGRRPRPREVTCRGS